MGSLNSSTVRTPTFVINSSTEATVSHKSTLCVNKIPPEFYWVKKVVDWSKINVQNKYVYTITFCFYGLWNHFPLVPILWVREVLISSGRNKGEKMSSHTNMAQQTFFKSLRPFENVHELELSFFPFYFKAHWAHSCIHISEFVCLVCVMNSKAIDRRQLLGPSSFKTTNGHLQCV